MKQIQKNRVSVEDGLPDILTRQDIERIYWGIADRLKKERIRFGLSAAQLEKRSGVDRAAIYRMENHQRRLGFDNMLRICYSLGLNPGELFDISK